MATKTVNAWLGLDGDIIFIDIKQDGKGVEYMIPISVLEFLQHTKLELTNYSRIQYTIPNGEEPEPETDAYTEDSPFQKGETNGK